MGSRFMQLLNPGHLTRIQMISDAPRNEAGIYTDQAQNIELIFENIYPVRI